MASWMTAKRMGIWLAGLGACIGVVGLGGACALPAQETTTAVHAQEAPALRAGEASELTTVSRIRALTPEQAGRKLPVRIRGVVTVLSGWKSSFFFQDATAGISVDRTNDSPQLQPGESVEVRGVT